MIQKAWTLALLVGGLVAVAPARAEDWNTLDPAYRHATPEAYEKWRDLKFFTITTKHHDGFCMWDTKTRVKRRVDYAAAGGPTIEECDLAWPRRAHNCRPRGRASGCGSIRRWETASGTS